MEYLEEFLDSLVPAPTPAPPSPQRIEQPFHDEDEWQRRWCAGGGVKQLPPASFVSVPTEDPDYTLPVVNDIFKIKMAQDRLAEEWRQRQEQAASQTGGTI